jgi:hypothetical protein
MALHLSNRYGCAILLLVLLLPATLTAYLMRSAIWLIVVPLGIIALVMIAAILAAVLKIKPKLTPDQFADKLERLLLPSAESKWDDDALPFALLTSVWTDSLARFERSI